MKTRSFLWSVRKPVNKYLYLLAALTALTALASAQVTASTTESLSSDCVGHVSGVNVETFSDWKYKDSSGVEHDFNGSDLTEHTVPYSEEINGRIVNLECGVNLTTSLDTYSTDGDYYLQATGGSSFISTTFAPKYQVVSVLYSPPGNQSSQGYGTSTTNGSTTTIGNSFTFSNELTFTTGIPNILSGGASTGWSVTSDFSSAFTQTWTDATSYATDDNSNSTYNPTNSNAINHNLDSFVIWLNPEVMVMSEGSSPTNAVTYTTGSQATPGLSAVVADVLPPIPAKALEAKPPGTKGVTTVPVQYLLPQAIAGENGVNVYMPGLAAICKNNTLYLEQLASASPSTPTACTQANQCGCTPSDFVTILQTDTLLNYNGTTLTADPYSGTTSPLEADAVATSSGPGSGASVCGENPVPTSANCRYVIVPTEKGSTTTTFRNLSGSQGVTFAQSDSTNETNTFGGSTSNSVGLSFGVGPIFSSLKITETWTWTNSESTGTSNGTGNTMSITLKTSNAACEENVNIYEDTVYHTYAFQVPTGITTCP